MAGSSSLLFSGSVPSETKNSWYSLIPIFTPGSAVQVIVLNASVISLPPTVTGLSSLPLTTSDFQPASGLVRTDVSGVSCGSVTSTLVVPALSRSFGTRNANVARPPWVNSDGWALTCADAMVGVPSTAIPATARTASVRTPNRFVDMKLWLLIAKGILGDLGYQEPPGGPRRPFARLRSVSCACWT